jgi:3-hydroxyisobutyrate dehydrogenase
LRFASAVDVVPNNPATVNLATLEVVRFINRTSPDGINRYGSRELLPKIIRRLEDVTGLDVKAPGFPDEMVDDEPEEAGYEVTPERGAR